MTKKSMPVTFAEFKSVCDANGYVATDQSQYKSPQNIYATVTKANRIKAEIKPSKYTVGFGCNAEELQLLREELVSKGYDVIEDTGKTFVDIVLDRDSDVMTCFLGLLAVLEDIQGIVRRQHEGTATKVFTRHQAETEIFVKIAKRYRNAIDNEDQDLLDTARDLLSGDSIDHIITRGESQARTPIDTYREHIVPCVLIHNRAIEMTLANEPITKVAHMIAANLAIVLISNAEQQVVDIQNKWRTTMPEGWNFGDSPFARLEQSGIILK
jgi:hypothetical protein